MRLLHIRPSNFNGLRLSSPSKSSNIGGLPLSPRKSKQLDMGLGLEG